MTMPHARKQHHGVECALYRRDQRIRDLTAERDDALRRVAHLEHQLQNQRDLNRLWEEDLAA